MEGTAPMPGADVLSAVSEFEARVSAFKALYAQSQAMHIDLERQRVELTGKQKEIESQARAAEAREAAIKAREAELAEERARAEEARRSAETLREELKRQADEAAAQVQSRLAEVDARAERVAEAESKVIAAEADLGTKAQHLAERERKAAAAEETAKKIRNAEQALAGRISELNQRQAQLKDEAAALAESKRLAAEQSAALERERLLLTEQQRDLEMQVQAVAADRLALTALEQEATEEAARLSSLRSELEAKASLLAERESRRNAEPESAANGGALEAQRDAALEEAAQERALRAQMLEVLIEYEQLWLLELRGSAAAAARPVSDGEEMRELVEGLKERLRSEIAAARALREELEQVKGERDQSRRAQSDAERRAMPGGAQRGTRSGSPAVESLERRRRRLRTMRELLRRQALRIRKAGEALRKRYEAVDQLLSQRAELAAARNRIIEAEKRQNRSRAASRAAVVVLCGVGVIALVGAMSWAVAREIAPATFEAVSIVKAEGRDRELSEAELREWQTFHEELLKDPRFHEAAAERFKRQGNTPFSTPAGVSDLIAGRVTTESLGDGELRLRLTGVGSDTTARTLETLTAGFMAYANSGHGRRLDGGTTVASQPATPGAEPIDSIRTTYTLGMLAVGVSLALGAALVLWKRLSGAKTAFEQDAQMASTLDETRWKGVPD
ncbi:MAG: hypothetical protein JNK25_15565 [Phycisphaerae bacterium]|nr:hypothetical protein [Phycisphaerae bacterium]